jgi:hypothetical protein
VEVLWRQARIGSACPNAGHSEGPLGQDRKGEGGAENLSPSFAAAPIDMNYF